MFIFVLFCISEIVFIISKFEFILFTLILGVLFFDLVTIILVFQFGIHELPGFKPIYPNFRFQGFYNLTINAILHSILLFYSYSLNKTFKKYLIPSGIVLLISLVLSLTRTAWLLFIISIIIYTLLSSGVLKNLLKFTLISVIAFIFLNSIFNIFDFEGINFNELFFSRVFDDTLNTNNEAELNRGNFFYPRKLLTIIDIKFMGNGLGLTEKIGGLKFSDIGEKLGAHNTFIHILLDYGILPFLLFVILIISVCYCYLYIIINKRDNLIVSNLSIFIGILFAFLFQDLDFYLPVMAIFVFNVLYLDNAGLKIKLNFE